MGARGRLAASGLVLFLVLAAGAAFVTGIVRLPLSCEGPRMPGWDRNPFGPGGVQVADLNEAAPYLAFTPVVPRALGSPAKFFVNGNRPDMSARDLLWWYEQPPYGRFWIRESIAGPYETEHWIESLHNNPTGCSDDSIVTLRGGTKAAVAVGNPNHGLEVRFLTDPAASGYAPGSTSIMWLDHGLLITAFGLTKAHAIEVANQM